MTVWHAVLGWTALAGIALLFLRGATQKPSIPMPQPAGAPFWRARHTDQENNVIDRLVGIHAPEVHCASVCVIHKPSAGGHRSMPLHWRDDRAIFERICEHGVGHPDPDQFLYWAESMQMHQAIHGCDGCCRGIGVSEKPDPLSNLVTDEAGQVSEKACSGFGPELAAVELFEDEEQQQFEGGWVCDCGLGNLFTWRHCIDCGGPPPGASNE